MLERNFHGAVLISGWALALWTERMGLYTDPLVRRESSVTSNEAWHSGSLRACGPLYHLQLVTTICDETRHLA